jgi:hypothetical protein
MEIKRKLLQVLLTIAYLSGTINQGLTYKEYKYLHYTDKVTFDNYFDITDYPDIELKNGDAFITQTTIQEIKMYEGYLNGSDWFHDKNNSLHSYIFNNSNVQSYCDPQYLYGEIRSANIVRAKGVIKSEFERSLPAGTSRTRIDFNIVLSVGYKVGEWTLGATFNTSSYEWYTGPNGNELITNNVYATHRYFSSVLAGAITKLIVDYKCFGSGPIVLTTEQNIVTNSTLTRYANFVNYNPNTGFIYLRSASSNSFIYIYDSNWKYYVNHFPFSGYTYVYF